MKNRRHSLAGAGLFIAMPLCMLLIAGCSKPETPPEGPPPGAPMGGPGGGGQNPRGGPVAANASGAEIYKAKCGCHGPGGKGGRAPVLTGVGGDPDSKLTTTVHDGHNKMPAFATQLTDAQITKVVAYIKGFKSAD
jgi:mono/diheme cytochrome c family protein